MMRAGLADTGPLRVEETRWAVGFLWLYPPFPASCPFKSTMAHRVSPLTDPTVQISRSGFFRRDSLPSSRCV
jgi:hypothetical protein